ncbi:MAG: anthranilate phosphoribosyltransferase [Nakamurella sp.]
MTSVAHSVSWPAVLSGLVARADLSSVQTAWVMDEVMSGRATAAQIAAFAVSLRAKGETPAELAGLVHGMLGHANLLDIPGRSVDIVGTGGDRANTVNISSMAAVVTAAAGAVVVKHGNRAASSSCGSADLLEGLGVAISLSPTAVAACVAEVGIGFCFAPVFHPSFRHTASPRREMGIPTVFNFLGPLTNPAQPAAGAIGCGDARMAPIMAQVFADRGCDVLLFRGDDGLDELTTTTTSTVWIVRDRAVTTTTVDPAALGIARSVPADLRGGDVPVNVEVAQRVFEGANGPVTDAVVLNAAAALAAHTGLSGDVNADLAVGIDRARAAIRSGAVSDLVQRWETVSTRLADAQAS